MARGDLQGELKLFLLVVVPVVPLAVCALLVCLLARGNPPRELRLFVLLPIRFFRERDDISSSRPRAESLQLRRRLFLGERLVPACLQLAQLGQVERAVPIIAVLQGYDALELPSKVLGQPSARPCRLASSSGRA